MAEEKWEQIKTYTLSVMPSTMENISEGRTEAL